MAMEVSRMVIYGVGQHVALFARKHLPDILKSLPSYKAKQYEEALKEAFLKVDEKMLTQEGLKELCKMAEANSPGYCGATEIVDTHIADGVGCTACVVLVTNTEIYVSNAGDSRCVVCKLGQSVSMSTDHKPTLASERARIYKAGGTVDGDRVNGILSLSRALGDFEHKQGKTIGPCDQIITAFPDVMSMKLSEGVEFVIIACDGIWDCRTSGEAVTYVQEALEKLPSKGDKPEELAKVPEKLFDEILARSVEESGITCLYWEYDIVGGIGCDNMSCIIIKFN